MALLIGVELFALYFSLNALSSVRAYVGGEGLWSKAQKDAVFHLYKYGASANQEDYLLFKTFMRVPVGDGKARQELQQANPDMERAKEGFLEGRNHPDDIEGMIWLFRNFSSVSYIDKAIKIWGEAEPIAMQLIQISEALHKEINSPSPSQSRIEKLLKSIDPINQRLTAFEDDFSYTLGEGSRWLERVVLKLLLVTAITVEITGLLLAISVSRGIQRGLTEIIRAANSFARGIYSTRAKVFSRDEIGVVAKSFNDMSDELERSIFVLKEAEKKFRGLLESAPDSMIIADKDGKIKRVNAQTERLFGCGRDYLLEQSVELLIPDRLRGPRATSARYFFDLAQTSSSGSGRDIYCRKKNGEEFPAEISIRPLETEEGLLVSAAIRDLSERKHVIAQRIRAEEALRRACGELRLRVGDLADANQQLRYEIAERERAQAELRRAFALLDQHVNNTPLGD